MERNGLTKSERAGATCPKHRRHSIIRAGSPENHTRTLISRSLCTCVRIPCAHRLQVFAMLLAYSLIPRLSHTQHHQHLSLSLSHALSFSLSFVPLPPSFSFPSVRSGSSAIPLQPLPGEIPILSTTSLTCGSFLRPQGPLADSPGRLTELTVSTAGWLGVATQPLDQPATFLLLRVYRRSAGVYLALPASLQPQFTHVTSSNRFAESSRLRLLRL